MMTSDQIRAELKQWDTFFNRVSKTPALLDSVFEEFASGAEFEAYCDRAMRSLEEFFKIQVGSLPGLYNGVDEGGSADCENFARWLVAEVQKLWRRDNRSYLEPALFTCAAKWGVGIHAITMAWSKGPVLWHADILTDAGKPWPAASKPQKVLALL